MFVSATKSLQLIVRSSFEVILAIFFLPPDPWVGVGLAVKVWVEEGWFATLRYLFLLLIQKYW